MINPSTLPAWSEIYERLGGPAPRRNRGQCLIHGGDSLTSVSLDHERGLYHCHVCGAGGDRVDYIMRVLQTDFGGALRWCGITPGASPQPDSERVRACERARETDAMMRQHCRLQREEYRVRGQVILLAHDRLQRDPDDEIAWRWLQWAYTGLDAIEYDLDEHDLVRSPRPRSWRPTA